METQTKNPKISQAKKLENQRNKNFEEISKLYRKAELLDIQIKKFKAADDVLKNIILKHKSEEMNIDEAGNMECEKDNNDEFTLKIYRKNDRYHENALISFSNNELLKECASVIAREADKARQKKETQLNEIINELKQ